MICVLPDGSPTTRVLRSATRARVTHGDNGASEDVDNVYELRPADPLPKLDLSLSMKSRFLSRSALQRFNGFVRQRKTIAAFGWVGMLSYFAAMVAPAAIGRPCALLSALFFMPILVAGFGLLRYEVVYHLLVAYDFWFCTLLNATTFVVLGLMMGDMRAIAILAGWGGIQMNVIIDAGVRAVRIWVIFIVLGAINFVAAWVAISLQLIDRMRVFTLLRMKHAQIDADAFVSSGLVTLIALLVRNAYRKRHALKKAKTVQEKERARMVECVSYRTNLIYAPIWSPNTTPQKSAILERESTHAEYMKIMQYVKQIGRIEARDTLLCMQFVTSRNFLGRPWISVLVHLFGVLAALVSVSSIVLDAFLLQQQLPSDEARSEEASFLSLTMTTVYCGMFMVHAQRKVFVALLSSFEFAFLSVQLTAVHVILCDFLEWNLKDCAAILVAWIWIHWVLMLDAVPPVMKKKLGHRKGFEVAVLAVYIGMKLGLVVQVTCTDRLEKSSAQVLWEGAVFSSHVQFRLLSIFCNCLGTALLLCFRLLWRRVRNDSDVLLVLDGAVAYENYLHTTVERQSRRWGSISDHLRVHPVKK